MGDRGDTEEREEQGERERQPRDLLDVAYRAGRVREALVADCIREQVVEIGDHLLVTDPGADARDRLGIGVGYVRVEAGRREDHFRVEPCAFGHRQRTRFPRW